MERQLIKRSDVLQFWGVPKGDNATFTRMHGFTEFSESKNPVEYSRKYVDEEFETTDVTGYSPSWSFAFDKYIGDTVLEDIADIIDSEVTGTDARRDVILVDFTNPVDGGYAAVKRKFSVIGDSRGDSTDAFNYSGTLRVVDSAVSGVATIATPTGGDAKTVETITFVESSATV